jgi:iron complex outermembrane receptor protein
VQNLFDRRYTGSVVVNAAGGRFYEPAPERTISVGLSLTTGH